MEVFVIGGGASGLVSGIIAARCGYNVTILERNSKCGKKLLLTGNGRSNFWNEKMEVEFYHTSNKQVFEKIFNSKKDKVLDFFKTLGLVYKVNNGYYYPFSNQSNSILNALLNELYSLKVRIKTLEYVEKIEKKDKFYIYTANNKYTADKVILAVGSKAFPKTGSDGNGYDLASSLGHTVNKVLPSLVKLKGSGNFYKDIKGVRSEVVLSLYENERKIKEEKGEVLFTEDGISGICTFNLSGIVARGLDKGLQEEIIINFTPWFKGNKNDLKKYIKEEYYNKKRKIDGILEGFLNYKLVNLLLKLSKIDINKQIEEKNLDNLVKMLMEFKIKIVDTSDFNFSQVATGGVPIEEVNPKTMESLKTKGLYLVGEVLDVDGICGGYNLGFAWISSLIAGEVKDD